jgi:hypothetical protein
MIVFDYLPYITIGSFLVVGVTTELLQFRTRTKLSGGGTATPIEDPITPRVNRDRFSGLDIE